MARGILTRQQILGTICQESGCQALRPFPDFAGNGRFAVGEQLKVLPALWQTHSRTASGGFA